MSETVTMEAGRERPIRWLRLVEAGCHWPGPHTLNGCTCRHLQGGKDG